MVGDGRYIVPILDLLGPRQFDAVFAIGKDPSPVANARPLDPRDKTKLISILGPVRRTGSRALVIGSLMTGDTAYTGNSHRDSRQEEWEGEFAVISSSLRDLDLPIAYLSELLGPQHQIDRGVLVGREPTAREVQRAEAVRSDVATLKREFTFAAFRLQGRFPHPVRKGDEWGIYDGDPLDVLPTLDPKDLKGAYIYLRGSPTTCGLSCRPLLTQGLLDLIAAVGVKGLFVETAPHATFLHPPARLPGPWASGGKRVRGHPVGPFGFAYGL